MSVHPALSPFGRLPEELLVMVLEEALVKDEPGDSSERPADTTNDVFHRSRLCRKGSFLMLKNLRVACREYTYLPRLLSYLFRTIRLVSTPADMRLQKMTDLSMFDTYVRCVVFDPRTYASIIGLEIGTAELQSVGTEILRQLPNAETFYVKPCEDVLFGAILASLGAAGSSARHLYLGNNTASGFKWATHSRLARIELSNLQTLVFRPTVEGSIGRDDETSHSSKALRNILKRCAQSIDCHDYESSGSAHVDIYTLGAFAAFLRTSCPCLEKLKLNRPKRLPGSGWWIHVWRSIREHPCRMQVDLVDIEGLGGFWLSFSHFTGDECRYSSHGETGHRSFRYAFANYFYGVDDWEGDCHMFDIAEGEDAWEMSDGEDKEDEG